MKIKEIEENVIKLFEVLDLSQLDKDKTYVIGVKFDEDVNNSDRYELVYQLSNVFRKEGYEHIYLYSADLFHINELNDLNELIMSVNESERDKQVAKMNECGKFDIKYGNKGE